MITALPSLRRALLRLFLTLSTFTLPAAAATINVPADQKTIQSAIDAALNGDNIVVAPGTYFENIDFKGKAITVTSSAGAAATIIDGGGKVGAATVTFATNETRSSVISNMTIRNGGPADQSSFIENSGGVFNHLSDPSILNNIITANFCNGVVNDSASPLIQGNTLSATIGAFSGACVLEKGAAIEQFSADYLLTDGSVPTIQGNIIENNVDGIYGTTGGIDFFGGDNTIVQGNTIRNNTGTFAGAISLVNTNTISILQNLVYGNSAGGAGAFYLEPPDSSVGPFTGIIAGNTIADNTVTYGKTYAGDTVSSQIYLSGNLAQWLLVDNIIVGNNAGTTAINCDVGYDYLTVTPLVFDHNDVYAADGVSYAGSCTDQTGSFGNINADPGFISPATGNYQLSASSPAVDTGNNSAPYLPAIDLLGHSRVQDATAKGYPVVDMGVYELAGKQPRPPTILTLTPAAFYYPGGSTNLGPFDHTPPSFTITLTSAAGVPSGPVTVYQDDSAIATVNVGSTGTATYDGAGVTPGLHAFIARYPGGSEFSPAVSVEFYLLVPATTYIETQTSITSSLNPANLGESVTLTATVTSKNGVPNGSVTFSGGGLYATQTLNNGIATYTTSALYAGTYPITVSYYPSAGLNFNTSSGTLSQTVVNNLFPTTTIISNTPDQTNLGEPVTIRVAISSTDPAFLPTSVSLSESYNGDPIAILTPDSSGYASFTTTSLPAGYQFLYANYTGDATHAASSAYTEQYVSNTAVPTADLTSSLDPAGFGQPVTFTATITSTDAAPAGVETFQDDNGNLLGTQPIVDGVASVTTSALAPGAHTITANYIPTGSAYTSLEAILIQVIDRTARTATTTALNSSLNPAPAGQTVTFTATVASTNGVPTGTVTFTDGTTSVGSQMLVNGVATVTLGSLAVGSHTITATYNPTGTNFNASAGSLAQTITGSLYESKIVFLSSPKTTNFGQSVTFTIQSASADTSYIPSPIVLAIDDTYLHSVLTTLTPDASGNATFTTTSLPIGVDHITATYAGDATHAAEQLPVDQDVIGTLTTTTSLTVIPTSGPYGTTISMYSQVVASSFSTASGTINVGSGTITYMDGATALTTITLAPNLIPNFNISTLAVGTHIITSVYSGDATFAPSTSAPVTVIITGDSTALSLAASPSPTASAFQTITLNAALTNLTNGINFPGTIAFLANGKSIGTAPIAANGGATLAVGLPAGTYILTASFAGSSALAAATSAPINVVVNPVATVTALFAKPNPGYQNATETLTATVNAQSGATTPSGTVNFLDGGALLASSPLDATGTATLSTAALAVGTHTLTAVYTGAQSFLTSTSQTVTLDILPSDFTLTSDPSITIQTEHHNSLAVTLASVGNFADTVTITCNNLPQYASCNFPNSGAQGSFQLATGATTAFTIDIDTDALLNFASTSHPQTAARLRNTIAFALLLPVTLFALRRKLPGELRSRATRLLLALFALTLAATLTGCSGHYPGHTLPGTYNITLTAKGNATGLTHSATVTLIVTE